MLEKISVIGLGKLGASMAAVFASRGFDVIGVDVNQKFIDIVNDGHAPVQETGLDAMIGENRERIRATLSHEEAVLGSDISFVIVPTPSDERGSFSLQYAEWAFKEIGKALRKKNGYHNVVLTSTVLPGSTRQALLPILEKESGKKAGRDFGVCYSPEFIALGSIIRNFLNPDFSLIGEFDKRSGDQLEAIYDKVTVNHAPAARMSLENAELTKISVNTFVTTKITFANMLADICEKLPGGDVDVVTAALGLDSRIGRKYLTGSIGYGGPCFPRDNVALSFIANELGVEAKLAETTDHQNRSIAEKTAARLLPMLRKGATVAILGLSYKPDSHVTEESQGVFIAKQLSKNGIRVVAYDPMSADMQIEELRRGIVVLDSIEKCLSQAEAVLITTPDPAFKSLTAKDFRNEWSQVLVVDFWRLLRSELEGKEHIKYLGIGLSEDDAANNARLSSIWCEDHSSSKGTSAE
ncbi:MAG: UDP-glucose/GDP-mannose dehydrogenase family protein [Acidobacteria bacterium]|nr:UDP-glucose/GDP-mannose dehydrogenase family protein [Acidobacteriota bacterium]